MARVAVAAEHRVPVNVVEVVPPRLPVHLRGIRAGSEISVAFPAIRCVPVDRILFVRIGPRRPDREGRKRKKTEQHSPNFVITNPDFVAHCDSPLPAGLFREKSITPSTYINFSRFPSDFFFGNSSAGVSSCCFVGTVSNRYAGARNRPKDPSNTVRWDLCGSRNPGGGVIALARDEEGGRLLLQAALELSYCPF